MLLHNVLTKTLRFEPGTGVTTNNSFIRVHGCHVHVLPGAHVEGNHFRDFTQLGYEDATEPVPESCSKRSHEDCLGGGFLVNATQGGTFQSNRIIRAMVHQEYPLASLYTDRRESIQKNVVLWVNLLQTGSGAGLRVVNASDFTLVAGGIETYGAGFNQAVISLSGVEEARLFAVGGRIETTAPAANGLYDLGKHFMCMNVP